MAFANLTKTQPVTVSAEKEAEMKEQLKREIQDLESQAEEAKKALVNKESLEGELSALKDQISKANFELQKIQEELVSIKFQQEDQVDAFKNTADAVIEINKDKAVITAEVSKLQSLKSALEGQVFSYEKQVSALEADVKVNDEELVKLRDQLDSIAKAKSIIVSDIESLKEDKALASQELEELDSEIALKTVKIVEIDRDLASKGTELADLQAKIDAQTGLNIKGFEESEALKAQYEADYQEKLKDLQSREGDLSDRLVWLDKKIIELKEAKKGMEDFFGKKLPNIIL